MNLPFKRNSPSITLGTRGVFPFSWGYSLKGRQLQTHKHIMGLSGQGKSYLLAKAASDLIDQGIPVSVIDPHSDLATDTLRLLIEKGVFKRPDAFKKLWFVDFSNQSRFIPFNVLSQPYAAYATASNIVESFQRAFPALSDGAAPVFENVLQFSTVALTQNNLPLTKITKLLADHQFREGLLTQCTHPATIEFFHDRYDKWGKEQQMMIESTLNKVSIVTFSDTLMYSLCQRENRLNFRLLIDQGISVIFNLGGLDERTQRLLGCFLTVGFEQAALSRGDIPADRRRQYHLIIDEFASFSTAKGETLSKILSQARKFNFFLWLAHQTWDQLPESLQGAIQNVGIEIYFALGFSDAQLVSPRVGHPNPYHVKHEVKALRSSELNIEHHPVYFQLQEEQEAWTRRLENLWEREAYVKRKRKLPRLFQFFMKPYKLAKIRTLTVPKQTCTDEDIQAVKDQYVGYLLRSKTAIDREMVTHMQQVSKGQVYRTRGEETQSYHSLA